MSDFLLANLRAADDGQGDGFFGVNQGGLDVKPGNGLGGGQRDGRGGESLWRLFQAQLDWAGEAVSAHGINGEGAAGVGAEAET